MFSLLLVALCAFVLSFVLTPLFRNLCLRRGWVDEPDHRRKVHTRAVPRTGGVPVFVAFAAAYGILLLAEFGGARTLSRNLPVVLGALPAVMVVFCTGLADDLRGLKPWQKLLGEGLAAGMACWAGVVIHSISGYPVPPWLAYPLTIAWLIGCTNAVNLIDGVDGLATGVGLFAAITTFIAGLLMGNYSLQLATVALIGALLGFLRYNFNPASIFLGDSGSLPIGFLLGCYGIVWSQKATTILGMTAPLIAFSIPLLDTALAVLRRLLRGQPICGADRRHIHHLLLDRGLTPRRVALLLYGVCAVAAVFALTLSVAQHRFSGLVIVIFCVSAWIGIQHLGYIEFNLAGHLVNPQTFRRVLGAQLRLRALEDALIRAQTVESCWSAVRDTCHGFGFDHVSMRLDHTVFFDSTPGAQNGAWSLQVPLSNEEFVRLERGFDSPIEPMIIEPLADLLRRTLTPKLPAFQWRGNGSSGASVRAAGL